MSRLLGRGLENLISDLNSAFCNLKIEVAALLTLHPSLRQVVRLQSQRVELTQKLEQEKKRHLELAEKWKKLKETWLKRAWQWLTGSRSGTLRLD